MNLGITLTGICILGSAIIAVVEAVKRASKGEKGWVWVVIASVLGILVGLVFIGMSLKGGVMGLLIGLAASGGITLVSAFGGGIVKDSNDIKTA
jgi:uncharacterized membrane protein HdeD (DUF308 family)